MNAKGRLQRGSVVVLAVGLLAMIVMIGSTFVIIAFLDRRESRSLATAAPMHRVALGVLDLVVTDRQRDLYLSGAGLYGGSTSYKHQVDYPHAEYDPALASTEPYLAPDGAWKWRHLTNLLGDTRGLYAEARTDNALLVDTDERANDGTNYGDAVLCPWGVYPRDKGGSTANQYHVAVRVVDASGLLNADTLYGPPDPAAPGTVMPVTNISLEGLRDCVSPALNDAQLNDLHKYLHNARRGNTNYDIVAYNANWVVRPLNPLPPPPAGNTAYMFLPFGSASLLSLIWSGSPTTATDRMYDAFVARWQGTLFAAARPYLTTWSSSRQYAYVSPQRVPAAPDLAGTVQPVDLNTATHQALFEAFYRAIPEGISRFTDGASPADRDRKRRILAGQLVVNVLDYRDPDDDVTVAEVYDGPPPRIRRLLPLPADDPPAGSLIGTVFGIERQPFLTEAWLWKLDPDGRGPEVVVQYSALELYNPYKSAISIKDWRLKVGTAAGSGSTIQNLPALTLSAGGRLVIVSDATQIRAADPTPGPPPILRCQDSNLDLRQTCTIYRPATDDPTRDNPEPNRRFVPICRTGPGDFDLLPDDALDSNVPVYCALRRDDDPGRAKYSVAVYRPYKGPNTTDPVALAADYHIGDPTCPLEPDTNLGRSNISGPGGDPGPRGPVSIATVATPVFVRNGLFLNLGDLVRVFYVGPDAADPLDEVLLDAMIPDNLSKARLDTLGPVRPSPPVLPDIPDLPDLPAACLVSDFLAALMPSPDNAGPPDTCYGKVNVNTAPWRVLRSLPGLAGLETMYPGQGLRDRVAGELIAYRDLGINPDSNGSDYLNNSRSSVTGVPDLRQDPGFATTGELAIPLRKVPGLSPAPYFGTPPRYGTAPGAYSVVDVPPSDASDDGLDRVGGDLSKHEMYYAWLSNQVTVRSDVFLVYIYVQAGQAATPNGRRYVAVIDRSNCRAAADRPRVLLFSEMK